MAALTIRHATKSDAHAIAEIHVAGWRVAYRGLMPDAVLESLSVEQRRGFWKGMIAKAGAGKVAVAEQDGGIVAFCSYGPTRDTGDHAAAEIYALYVQPGKWRQGSGRALCQHAAGEAAERELKAMTLWVVKGNDPARRFYERLGYSADGAQRTNSRFPDVPPFLEVRYRKAIA